VSLKKKIFFVGLLVGLLVGLSVGLNNNFLMGKINQDLNHNST